MSLETYSIEELEAEIEKRQNSSIVIEKDFTVPFSEYRPAHRNYEWMPLRNSEPNKKIKTWMNSWLIPIINQVSNCTWESNSYLIQMNSEFTLTTGTIDDYANLDENVFVKSIRQKFPTVKVEDFGYKIDKVLNVEFQEDFETYSYSGLIVLNPMNIKIRGEIIGNRFNV